jgi:rhomboid family GlyGly-CTERM serine protease
MPVTTPLSALRDGLAAVHAEGARGWWLAALLAALLLPDWLGSEALRATWRYERDAIAAGALWRAFSGQFVHLDAMHALANAAGAVLIWALVGKAYEVLGWSIVLAVTLASTAAGLWWLSPSIAWYVGGSGFLHGLLVAGALRQASQRDPIAWIVLAVVATKLVFEQWSGPLSAAGGAAPPVVTVAHLYGALGGALAGGVSVLRERL